jgi:hypothetical protein
VLVGKLSVTVSPGVGSLAAVYVNVASPPLIKYSLILIVSAVSNAATAGLLDVQVTADAAGTGPGLPFESVVATVNGGGSLCPVSRFEGSGTVAFAGEIVIELTVAAITPTNAVTVCGAVGSDQIVGSVAEIVEPGVAVPFSVAPPGKKVTFAVKPPAAFAVATVTTAPLKNVLVGNPESDTTSPVVSVLAPVVKLATPAAIDHAVIASGTSSAVCATNCPGASGSGAAVVENATEPSAHVNSATPVMSGAVPSEYVAVAAICTFCPTTAVTLAGVTVIVLTCAGVTVIVMLPWMIPDVASVA